MRIAIQALSLLLFTVLFIFAAYSMPDWLPADIYLRLDPLLGLSAVLSGREIIARALWSLIVIGTALFIGRFFCAYICPMGAAIDFLDRLFFRNRPRPGLKNPAPWRKAKFSLLVVFLVAALAGVSAAYLLDPMPLLTRFYTLFLYPLVITLLNGFLALLRPVFGLFGWVELSYLHYPQPFFFMTVLLFLIFGGIIFLNEIAPRFWCRYLCPLGALLGLLSIFSFWKRRVGPECNECAKCRRSCPMGAIDQDPKKTRQTECIQCRTCAGVCAQEAVGFSPFNARKEAPVQNVPLDASRRGFLFSVAGGLTAAFLIDRSPAAALQGKIQLIRPPGALPEKDFLRTCIRCGECLKSCLTNTLQPCLWESGLSGLWTPKMDLRLAACEQNCNVCGKVCPTQAVRSLSLEEKTHAKVGTAVLRKELCLVWAQDKICLICDEICPYNAIVFRPVEGVRRPVVIASRCNGCGFCEARCPVLGESAITVVPQGEIRLKEGSYVKEAKRLELDFRPDPGDDKYILESSGLKASGETKTEAPEKGMAPSPMPKGFTK